MLPKDSFTNAAILKLNIPDQIDIDENATLVSTTVMSMSAIVTVKF